MALGSGLGSQFGFAAEASAWGTRAAPDHWLPVTGWDLRQQSERATGAGIRAGAFVELLSHHVETHSFAEADLELEVVNKSMGRLFAALFGTVSGPTQIASTAAYSQTHTLSAINPGDKKSLTLQGGTPLRSGGTAITKEMTGARMKSAEFSCEVGGALQAKFEFVGKVAASGTQTLGTVSYPAGLIPFRFRDGAVKTGTYGSEAALVGVRSMSVKYELPLDEPFYFGNAGLMVEPVQNGFTQITGTIVADHDTATAAALEARSLALTSTSIVWEFVGPTAIEASNYPTCRFTIPGCVFESKIVSPDGVKEISPEYTFKAFDDGTNAASVYLVSTDTAL